MPNIGENISVVKRQLTVFFILDKSGSMETDGRIARLNDAIPVTVESLKQIQEDNPNLRIKIKTIAFSDRAEFYLSDSNGADLENFVWSPLKAGGRTTTASAVKLLCEQLEFEKMPRRGYPPVCVLVSDGYCTDEPEDYQKAIDRLNKEPWGKKAARIVVSIGDDIDEESLRLFVNERGSYINCVNASEIIDYIRLKTTEATISSTESVNTGSSAANPADTGNNFGNVTVDPNDVF